MAAAPNASPPEGADRSEPIARGELRCALCHAGIDQVHCSTLLHEECRQHVAECPTLGCGWRTGGMAVEVPAPISLKPGRRGWGWLAVMAVVLVVGALLVAGGRGLTVTVGRAPPSAAMEQLCEEIGSGSKGIESVPRLLEILRTEPLTGWWMSRGVVVSKFGPALVPVLREAWPRETNARVREWMMMVFDDLGPAASAALPEIVESLGHPDQTGVRSGAIGALLSVSAEGAALPPECVPKLVDVMESGDWWNDSSAIFALRRLAPNDDRIKTAIVNKWVRDLQRPGPSGNDPRMAASFDIANNAEGLDTRRTIPGLLAALKDPDHNLRLQAARAIEAADPQNRDALMAIVASHVEILRQGGGEAPMFAALTLGFVVPRLGPEAKALAAPAVREGIKRGVAGAKDMRWALQQMGEPEQLDGGR